MADTNVPEIVGKAGVATSEFWVVVITLIGNFATHIWGHDWGITANAQNIVAIATTIASAIYALSRSWVKGNTHKAIATERAAALQAASYAAPLANFTPIFTNAGMLTHVLNTVTGDVKAIVAEEKQAAERAWKEQQAIAQEAKQDVSQVVGTIHPVTNVAPTYSGVELVNTPPNDPGDRPSSNPR